MFRAGKPRCDTTFAARKGTASRPLTSTPKAPERPRSNRRLRRKVAARGRDRIRFTEEEVAQILWVLSEASDLAGGADALSSLAMIEDTLRMVRERFDRRGPQ